METTKDAVRLLIEKPEFAQAVELARPLVERIESGPEITKGHYGEYMTIINLSKQKTIRAIILLHAGANREGIASACQILGIS